MTELKVVDDKDLTEDLLMNTDKIVVSKSEHDYFKRIMPWTYGYDLLGNLPESKPILYVDIGISLFKKTVTLESSAHNILNRSKDKKQETSKLIDFIKSHNKLGVFNKLGKFLFLDNVELNEKDPLKTAYNLKKQGLKGLSTCFEILRETKFENGEKIASRGIEDFLNFQELREFNTNKFDTLASYVFGSYIDFKNGEKLRKNVSDIDGGIVIPKLDYKLFKKIVSEENIVDDFKYTPNIVPIKNLQGYAYFNLNHFNYKHKMIVISGNINYVRLSDKATNLVLLNSFATYLKYQREYLTTSEPEISKAIKEIPRKPIARIRIGDEISKDLKSMNYEFKPTIHKNDFNQNLSSKDVKRLIARSTIETSKHVLNFNKVYK